MASPALAKYLRFDIIGNDLSRFAFESVRRNAVLTGATLRSALAGLGVPLSAGAAVAAFTSLTDKAMEFADTLKAQADKLQISTDRLQEYRYAAKATGGAYEDADAALESWTRRLGEAQQGTGKSYDVLKQYNIALFDHAGRARDADAVLRDLFDAVSRLRDPQERLRVLARAGGDELARLATLARQGSDGLDHLAAQARETGQVLGRETLDSLAEVKAKVDDLNKAIEINSYKAAANVAPWRVLVSELELSVSKSLGDVAKDIGTVSDAAIDLAGRTDVVGGFFDALTSHAVEAATKLTPVASALQALHTIAAGIAYLRRDSSEVTLQVAPPPPARGQGSEGAAAAATSKQQEILEQLRFEQEQLGRTNVEQEIYANLKRANVSITSEMGAAIATETAKLYQATQAQKELNDLLKYGGDTAIDFIDRLVIRGDKLADVFADVGQSLARVVLQAAILGEGPLASVLGTASTGSGPGGVVGALASLFGGSRAGGGPVEPGRIYRVHKDEWIVPRDPGTVIPMRAGVGGNRDVSVNVNVINNNGSAVETSSRQNQNGGVDIEVLIGNAAAKQASQPGSALDRILAGRGAQTPPVRR